MLVSKFIEDVETAPPVTVRHISAVLNDVLFAPQTSIPRLAQFPNAIELDNIQLSV